MSSSASAIEPTLRSSKSDSPRASLPPALNNEVGCVGWNAPEVLRQVGDHCAIAGAQGGEPAGRQDLAQLAHHVGTARHIGGIVKDGIAEQDDVGHGYQSLANCRGGHAAERGGARQEEAAAVDHLLWSALAGMPEVFMKIWWVPEELNLSTPAALFHSRPGYSRLSGKGPGAGGPI